MKTLTRGRTDEGVALIDAIVALAVLLVAVVVILLSFAQVGRGNAERAVRAEQAIEEQNEAARALPAARAERNDLR
jgi:Tfp pilus assembly protein PilV